MNGMYHEARILARKLQEAFKSQRKPILIARLQAKLHRKSVLMSEIQSLDMGIMGIMDTISSDEKLSAIVQQCIIDTHKEIAGL